MLATGAPVMDGLAVPMARNGARPVDPGIGVVTVTLGFCSLSTLVKDNGLTGLRL